jgi:hypothetical protein
MGWSIRSGPGHVHQIPSRASCIAKQPILDAVRTIAGHPDLRLERVAILKNVNVSIGLDFSLLDGARAMRGHSVSP